MTHLRKMMLEELQRRNYSQNTTRCYIRTVEDFARRFNRPPDRLGPQHIREYQADCFRSGSCRRAPSAIRLAALRFFYTKTLKKAWSIAETPYPKKSTSPADDPEPGRSRATHRRRSHSLPSHPPDDALRHRRTQRRVDAPESQRHRQPAHGDSRSGRQGTQRSRCHAQPQTARGTARSTGAACGESPAYGCFLATATTAAISPSIPRPSGTPASKPPSERALKKACIPTRCATASPRICSKRARICAPFRSC